MIGLWKLPDGRDWLFGKSRVVAMLLISSKFPGDVVDAALETSLESRWLVILELERWS